MVVAYTSRIVSTLAFILISVFALYAGRQCFVPYSNDVTASACTNQCGEAETAD